MSPASPNTLLANPPRSTLSGQVAVVTGASGGIGRAVATALAAEGAAVLVHGFRLVEATHAVAQEINAVGAAAVHLGDLSDPDARNDLLKKAWAWRGGVDVWINCAGADVLTGDVAQWPFERKLALLWQVDVEATI